MTIAYCSPFVFRIVLNLTLMCVIVVLLLVATTTKKDTKKGNKKDNKKGGNVQPMRVGKDGDSASGSPMRTPSEGSDNDA